MLKRCLLLAFLLAGLVGFLWPTELTGADKLAVTVADFGPLPVLAQASPTNDRADGTRVQQRLLMVAVFGGGLLALMGVLFVYLRLEHASRGFHSGRLQMFALMAATLILLVCYGLGLRWNLFG